MKKFILCFILFLTFLLSSRVYGYTSTNFRIDWQEIYVEVPLNASIEMYKRKFVVNVYVDEILLKEDVDYYVVVGVNGTSLGTINTSNVGNHRIDVLVSLYDYSATSVNTITYSVVDKEAPEFDTSINAITTKYGVKPDYESYFNAYDNSGKDVKITVDDSGVDYNTIGTKVVTIIATDVNGQITRLIVTVYVVDEYPPTITLINLLIITIGSSIDVSKFFKGYDEYQKDITSLIKIESYNNMLLGEQQIYVSLEDSSGNYTRVQFTLTITDDTAPIIYFNTNDPKIDISGDITYDIFKSFILYVEDDGERLNIDDVRIDFSSVLSEIGTYTVIYYATDKTGNTCETRLSVKVVQFTGPTIICTNIYLKTGDIFDENLVKNYITVYDQYDTSAINTLRVDLNGVNLGVAGVYPVLVSACNSSGIFTYETLIITVEGNGFNLKTYWPLSLIVIAPIGYYAYQMYMKKKMKKYED